MQQQRKMEYSNKIYDEASLLQAKSCSPKHNQSTNNLLTTIYSKISPINHEPKKHQSSLLKQKYGIGHDLPKIYKKPTSATGDYQIDSIILSKTNKLLNNKLCSVNRNNESTISSLMRSFSNISMCPLDKEQFKTGKQNKFRLKTNFKRTCPKTSTLPREHRFFQDQPAIIPAQIIQSLGCYEASNIFKSSNIGQSLQKLAVVAERPEFNLVKTTNKHELFLTNVQSVTLNFCVENFIEEQLNKEKQRQRVINECDSLKNSQQYTNQIQNTNLSKGAISPIQQSQVYIIFKDYEVVKNEDFYIFRIKQLVNWGQIQANISTICKCLKSHRISFLTVKSEKIAIWRGRRLTFEDIKNILSLQFRERPFSKIFKICLDFLEKLKGKINKKHMARKQWLARWVVQRLRTLVRMRRTRSQKLLRAQQLHFDLTKHMKWQVQIYLSSFSVDYFKRSTTQYMQTFENIYHSIWKASDKPLVLVLPTLNENVLQILQSKFKPKRNITIICPEIHEAFPPHLSLASQVLFSYETLKKIKTAIGAKSAVLISGGHESQTNQLLLSEYLNVPLLSTLNINNGYQHQKQFFSKANVLNPAHCIIPPSSTFTNITQIFARLLINYKTFKKWVVKLNGEFKGRGIGTITINPSKYLKGEDESQNIKLLHEYLRMNLKLKLKINFQNSLFTVEEFVTKLQEEGGVIDEYIGQGSTYELCFNKLKTCQLICSYKIYGLDYSNKAWLSCELDQQILQASSKIQEELQQGCYYGFISVTICKTTNKVYGIDLKLRQTHPSSVVSFIQMIEDRRNIHLSSAISINQLPTKRTCPQHYQQSATTSVCDNILQIPLQHYHYLIIPDLVFTDIDQTVKAQLIQDLMKECWTNRHLKLHQDCSVYLSMGVDFSLIVMGRDIKHLKKRAIVLIRQLNDRTSSFKQYRGKQITRDVFRYSEIIRALTQIKTEQ